MKIVTLGNCCKKSQKNHQNTVEAAKKCGIENVENIGDLNKIMEYGVMTTPAIVIDNEVVSSGKMMKTKDIEKLIKERLEG